jgi:ubiquinone/menaquinone biosynthesis C-methylase UbiE
VQQRSTICHPIKEDFSQVYPCKIFLKPPPEDEEKMNPADAAKPVQKETWAHFARFDTVTMLPAASLVKFAGISPGLRVLDVACGTGVVAITAARMGANVTGLDLTPELLERARDNSQIARLEIEWHEGDVEKMPFKNGTFDAVLSQYGHMFAPKPELALSEMLRVLKPGGTIAFSTWPPDLMMGRMFSMAARHMSGPPPGVASPVQWGDPTIVRERLGSAVTDLVFDTGTMLTPALSPQHFRITTEQAVAPLIKLVAALATSDPEKLASFRSEYEELVSEYFHDNAVHQGYLMTRATKR